MKMHHDRVIKKNGTCECIFCKEGIANKTVLRITLTGICTVSSLMTTENTNLNGVDVLVHRQVWRLDTKDTMFHISMVISLITLQNYAPQVLEGF